MTDLAALDLGVRLLYAHYADAVWRKDRAAFVACFTADACWTIAGAECRGAAAIGDAIERLLARSERVRLSAGQPMLAIGAEATGRVPITELVKLADGGGMMTLGTYHDLYAGAGHHRRFARHHFTLHYRGPPDLSAALNASPEPDAFAQGDGLVSVDHVRYDPSKRRSG